MKTNNDLLQAILEVLKTVSPQTTTVNIGNINLYFCKEEEDDEDEDKKEDGKKQCVTIPNIYKHERIKKNITWKKIK